MKKIILVLAGCLGACAWGAVQNVTITSENAYAYSADNLLECDSGSKIILKYSYSERNESLKEKLLDFIRVTPPAEGEPEPWVSICLQEAGLTNNVDFSEQPYLWLGAPGNGSSAYTLTGIYEPYGDVYRFGYAGGTNGEKRGLIVTNLVDNPVTGAPRSVLVRGDGLTSFSGTGCSYTGGMVIEGPAWVSVNSDGDFGTGRQSNPTNFVTLRNVNGKPARINFKTSDATYATNIRIEGTNNFHACGASKSVCTTYKGAITGWGQIDLTDQGGVRFTSPSNTFTDVLKMKNTTSSYLIEIGFGDGVNCSWQGSEIIQNNYTNNVVVVNCGEDFTFNTTLSANGGRLIKKGTGTLTLGTAFPRTMNNSRPDVPVMQILGGRVKRTLQEPTAANGLVQIAPGCTLDLNRVPAASVWLPYGGGAIVNSAEETVTLKGPANEAVVFNGTIEGRAKLVETANVPWRLGALANFVGGLEISSGSLEIVDGFSVSDLALPATAVVGVLPHEGRDEGGLKMEAWHRGSAAWSGDGHGGRLATAIAYAEANAETPSHVGDMTTFGETFYSGTGDEAGRNSSAFYKAFGASKDNFVAKFTGYITIEADGLYGFRGAADDAVRIILDGTNTVVNYAAGSHNSWGTKENVPLTAGRHPITVYFVEESGLEILWVQMKKPGGSWEYIPTRLLSTWDGGHSNLGTVTGEGALELMAADVPWPQMDLADFTGRLVVGEAAASDTVGFVEPVNAYLHFPGAMDLMGTNWWRSGRAAVVVKDGRLALDLGGVENSNTYVNRTRPLDLTKPFTVSFDFSIHEPWGSAGDGFCLMLHDKANGTYGGSFTYDEAKDRINNKAAYGIQAYMMPTVSDICWVKDNRQLGTVATNYIYKMDNAKDRTRPFHVTMAWDLEKLVCSFERVGERPFALTNTTAVADFAEKFPSNQAYLGIWARNGGYYCAMLFENLVIDEGASAGELPTVTLNGVMGITNGVAQVLRSDDVEAVIASELRVTGAGGIGTASVTALTGDVWTFDLRNPDAKLTLTGPFSFPAESIITVDLEGAPDAKTRVLADLTEVTDGAADGLRFQLDPDLPAKYRLVYEDGLLKISAGTGTTVFIR